MKRPQKKDFEGKDIRSYVMELEIYIDYLQANPTCMLCEGDPHREEVIPESHKE